MTGGFYRRGTLLAAALVVLALAAVLAARALGRAPLKEEPPTGR